MKKYDEYKDSGVAWIGEVPKHWEILRGKYVLKILSGFPFDSQKFEFEDNGVYMPLIRIRDINGSSTEVYYSGSYPIESVVKTGEVLIGMDGDFNISKWKGTNALLNQRVCKLREDSSMNTHYAFYMLSSPLKAINSVTYATTVKHLSVYDIYNAFIPVPPISEQAAISTYLDTHCAKIDNLISIQQKRIALLQELKQSVITHAVTKGLNPNVEMKPSGIEWIGDVPKHWEVMPLKHLAVLYPKSVCSNNKENIVSYAPMENVRNDKLTEDEKKITELTSGLNTFYEGDILMAKVTPCFENGNIAIAHSLKHSLGYCSSELFVIRVKRINVRYLFFLLQNQDYKQVCLSTLTGTGGLKRVSADFVRSGKMPVPSQEEQAAIASYLDRKCATIDTSISNAQHQIDLLQEYKQSLITEVVTGKRKVTDN